MNTPAEALWTFQAVFFYLFGVATFVCLLVVILIAAWRGRKAFLEDAQELVRSAERASEQEERKRFKVV
jgi:hypothetical protein